MKYIKLFFLSILVFGLMLFVISLLFPSLTVVSRAVNVFGKSATLHSQVPLLYQTAFTAPGQPQASSSGGADDPVSATRSGANLFPATTDTLIRSSPFAVNIQQGIALHELAGDSTAVQAFYLIRVPWYRFWSKFGLMLNEAKYGPSLDSAVERIRLRFSDQVQ